MSKNFDALPNGYIMCPWCQRGVRQSSHCSYCKLSLTAPQEASEPVVSQTKKPVREKPTRTPGKTFKPAQGHITVLGIDPGARYTGITVRDNDDPVYSGIFVRPDTMSATQWALESARLSLEVYEEYKPTYVALEGISDPKGFYKGEQAAINPKDIIRTGIVLGALVATWPDAIIVEPGGNGDRHESFYPACLSGRRPKDLPGSNKGSNTRKHEKSAYDVAGKAQKSLRIFT
jgi:hypothetical protein